MSSNETIDNGDERQKDFIRSIVAEDIKNNKNNGRVNTRFPPEPNGFLHIGHAKAICLDFSVAEENNGLCNLRFDDTNPVKEEIRYEESIKEDIRWLGFDWDDRLFYASDYFDKLYEYAVELIKMGKAYVCHLTPEETRDYRGTLTEAGKNSPYRNRSVEENLELFEKMKKGEFKEGECTLRAKIDMASPNINMRDPAIYRIKYSSHNRTGDKWCIYPMYDYTHCLSDSIEGITHSLCTLEFENHRPLYDWFLDELNVECHPKQIEFARLNMTYTVMSKRKLLQLVEGNYVSGWDDPRMPTLAGMRRRGYTAEAIKEMMNQIGISKVESIVDIAFLQYILREQLNKQAQRVMAVLKPLKLIIDNYPEGETEELEAENNPEDPGMGKRKIPFGKVLYIEKDDFMIDPPKKYFRLSPGREIRLKHAYYVTCVDYKTDEKTGEVTEVHCTYDPETRGGWSEDGRKVKGTSHWVSAEHALDAEVRLYEHLFTKENPDDPKDEKDFKEYINPESLIVLKKCKIEPSLKNANPETKYQFLRQGYYCADSADSAEEKPVFNRIVSLRDKWSKIKKKQG
jgi:glutaminyl-tRNA synthetase